MDDVDHSVELVAERRRFLTYENLESELIKPPGKTFFISFKVRRQIRKIELFGTEL